MVLLFIRVSLTISIQFKKNKKNHGKNGNNANSKFYIIPRTTTSQLIPSQRRFNQNNFYGLDKQSESSCDYGLLAALLAAQKQGQNPVYGVYIIRQMWIFVVLDNQKYALSKAFITDRKEKLEAIFKMLKAQKEMILEVSPMVQVLAKLGGGGGY